jgi:beta-alanine degradation protein BauB
MAKAKVMIDNEKTRVTEWVFDIGDETGQHIHEFDYVVVPMLDGELKIINKNGEESISKLLKGGSYFRNKGVNHNVINNNNYEYSFVEIEFK